MLADFARCLHGSVELFEHNGRKPSASINFVTSHDGFTLADLVSYNDRHNEANGESNHDGHSANFSYNYGAEGTTDEPAILQLRDRQIRNLLATLLLAQGTPMLLAGDEIGRSQQGNNNAYCQDNDLTWLDWSLLDTHSELHDMVKKLLRIRRNYAVLHRDKFLHDNRIGWLGQDGQSMTGTDWHDPERRFLAMLLSSAEFRPGQQSRHQATIILGFNAAANPVEFELPKTEHSWRCVFSTSIADPDPVPVNRITLDARSVQIFELTPSGNG